MKRKTWIILGSAYLLIVVVILVVALLQKDSRHEALEDPKVAGETQISALGSTGGELQLSDETESGYLVFPGGTAEKIGMETAYPQAENLAMTSTFLPTNQGTQVALGPTATWGSLILPSATLGSGGYIISTATPLPTSTRTATPTHTSAPQKGWEGEWVVWYGTPGGSLLQGSMDVTVSGSNLTAMAIFDSGSIEFSGEIRNNEQESNGTYSQVTGDGWFFWQMISGVQFGGTLDNSFAFCAARIGQAQPNPCGIYSPY